MDESSSGSSRELLAKVRHGAHYGNIQLSDVEEVLSNELFFGRDGLLTTTERGSTLLHLAAQTKGGTVLPLVCQAYKRSKLFPEAMLMVNKHGLSPLHVAMQACRFENAVLLFKDCVDLCSSALEPDQDGWTLMHSAASSAENLNMIKYLLAQDVCRPMVLSKGKSPSRQLMSLPEDIARDLVTNSEFYLKTAEQQLNRFTSGMSSFARDNQARTMVDPKKKVLEKAKDLYAHIQQATLELKAEEAKELARQLERTKHLERQTQLNKELDQLLQINNWKLLTDKYLLSESEETRKIAVQFLVSTLQSGNESFSLPTLSLNVLTMLTAFLLSPEEDPCVISTLRLLERFTKSADSARIILNHQDVELVPRLVHLLSSLDTSVQSVCVSIFLNLVTCQEFNCDQFPHLVQGLLLIKHFSLQQTARRLSLEVLERAGDDTPPDPGSWCVRQVSVWLDSFTELDQRSDIIQGFKDGGIDGLHLLELSVGEMSSLGVRFVSHQRKLSDKIDELRRMNMRSEVGQKDVFLSYAHVDINFARKIKRVLNNAQYSVWIDESGIRAGQKWRNEIADGVHGCGMFLFVLSKRSANSRYCHNEVALAEEYHKPILTVKVQAVPEMDPGLQFVIGRQQWIDLSVEETFDDKSGELIDALRKSIGEGRGIECDNTSDSAAEEQPPHQSTKHGGTSESGPPAEAVWEREVSRLREAMEASLTGVYERMDKLETNLKHVTDRITAVELRTTN